jgi:hypothetical protein
MAYEMYDIPAAMGSRYSGAYVSVTDVQSDPIISESSKLKYCNNCTTIIPISDITRPTSRCEPPNQPHNPGRRHCTGTEGPRNRVMYFNSSLLLFLCGWLCVCEVCVCVLALCACACQELIIVLY